MMPKQEPPYTRLIDSARRQPEETQEDVNGTVIGFFTPELFHGIGSGGFHIHFANDDRNFGGHILDFEVDDVKLKFKTLKHLNNTSQSIIKRSLILKLIMQISMQKSEKLNNILSLEFESFKIRTFLFYKIIF